MADPNVFAAEWQSELEGARGTQVGRAAGSRELGAAVFELDPGGQAAPYHAHHGNEELVVVLEGRPELRTPQGRRVLEPGAVVAFPRGAGGTHRLRNTGDAPVRYLIVSTMNYPDIAEHVDTGTVLAITGPQGGYAFPAGSDKPHMETVRQALASEPDADEEAEA